MATRASSSSLKDVMNTLTALVFSTGIVATEQVFQAMDPDGIPSDLPVDTGKLITVSLARLQQWEADSFAGDTGTRSEDTSACAVVGDLRVTLWLRMQADRFGRFTEMMDALGSDSTGTAQQRDLGSIVESDPAGQGYLTKLLAKLWDADPVGSAGTLVLMRPLEFVGIEFPKESDPDPSAWYPFKLIFNVYFIWNLGLTLSPG